MLAVISNFFNMILDAISAMFDAIGAFIEYTNGLYFFKTNLFNFVIFASIIAFLFYKLKVTSKLDEARNTVKDTIDESETAKIESETRLSNIKESISHIGDEIDEILQKSEENAQLVGAKILQDAEITCETIRDNTEKSIENKTLLLKNDLMQRAAKASVEVAKAHIIEELNNNRELHDKLIDESIEAIEGVQYE